MTELSYDSFPSNICETAGTIPRDGFDFHFSRVVVWQGGQSVLENYQSGVARAQIVLPNRSLQLVHDHPLLDEYFNQPALFPQISTNFDRIMWSVNIFATDGGPDRQAMILSLLFKMGELSLIKINIDAPIPTQIELFRV